MRPKKCKLLIPNLIGYLDRVSKLLNTDVFQFFSHKKIEIINSTDCTFTNK